MATPTQDANALLIVVSFRNSEVVRTLVDSLGRLEKFPALRLLIADNASSEQTLEAMRRVIAGLPNVELLPSSTNRGYFGAARYALEHYQAQNGLLPDWVIVSNPDIVLEDGQFLNHLFGIDPCSVGVVAPRIVVSGLNLNQNPFMRKRPGRLKRFTMRLHVHDYFLCSAWDWLSRVKRAVLSKIVAARPAGTAGKIYAPHGSFIIFSRKYFEAGGYLDDQLFLFCEEITVGEICRTLGLPVLYSPSLTVIHNEHQSIGVGMTRAIFNYHRQSIRHVLSKYLTTRPQWEKITPQTQDHP